MKKVTAASFKELTKSPRNAKKQIKENHVIDVIHRNRKSLNT